MQKMKIYKKKIFVLLRIVFVLVIFILLFNKLYADDIPVIVIAPSKKAQSLSAVGTSVTVLDETFFKNSNEFFLSPSTAQYSPLLNDDQIKSSSTMKN